MAIGPVKKGALHKALGVSQDKKLSSSDLAKAANSSDPKMRKRAAFAKAAKKWHHGGKKRKY